MRFFSFLLASAAVFYACSSDDGSSANDSAGISDDTRDFQDSLYIQGPVVLTKGSREFGECLAELASF